MDSNIFKLTADFAYNIIGMKAPFEPSRLAPSRKIWTLKALREEVKEFKDAHTLEDEVDALIDIMYFAAGRFHEMGVNGLTCFHEVHRANMQKERGALAKRGNDTYDAIKPVGWKGPDITQAIYNTGLFAKPKICVIGYGRHGKDSVCEALRNRYGLKFQSSSLFCAERVLLPYFNSQDHLPSYKTAEECYLDRHGKTRVSGPGNMLLRHRDIWFQQIEAYNSKNWSRLAEEMMLDYDIYCGLRSATELMACVKRNIFDVIVWVDRSKIVAPESATSISVTSGMADIILDNNGDFNQMSEELDKIYNYIIRS